MSERSAYASSLLSTPICNSLNESRRDLAEPACTASHLSVQEFVKTLRKAVSSGDTDNVHRLLRIPKHPTLSGLSEPFLCTAAGKGYADIVGLLIRHGSPLSVRNTDDSTALICAADNGFLHVLSLLLNAGSPINLRNKHGETALARSTRRGWVNCARLLLSFGANIHPMPTDGHSFIVSPLHLARQMHQSTIEKEILRRSLYMDTKMMEVVQATLPKHIQLIEPGHLVDTKTLSFFPVQLLHEAELKRFVLCFKTPPGYNVLEIDQQQQQQTNGSNKRERSHSISRLPAPADELVLVYVVRAQIHDGQTTCWLNGPGFDQLTLSFNGTHKQCTRLPELPDYPGLSIYSITLPIRNGGLNTLCLESTARLITDKLRQGNPHKVDWTRMLSMIGAYRVRIDVTSLIQSSAGRSLDNAMNVFKPTIYIPHSS